MTLTQLATVSLSLLASNSLLATTHATSPFTRLTQQTQPLTHQTSNNLFDEDDYAVDTFDDHEGEAVKVSGVDSLFFDEQREAFNQDSDVDEYRVQDVDDYDYAALNELSDERVEAEDWSDELLSDETSSSLSSVNSINQMNGDDVNGQYNPPQLSAADLLADGNHVYTFEIGKTHPQDQREIAAIQHQLQQHQTTDELDAPKAEPVATTLSSSPQASNSSVPISDGDYAAIVVGALGGLLISFFLFAICIVYVKYKHKTNEQKQQLSHTLTDKQLRQLVAV